ncbi:hypothetical protein BLNAU_8522 [Blattamonas nauphoetae]|uniref:Uncharacterized protein n=1 Tax=Blattamonas nauphoetae TaxID=2049346 RepID=A0ABQ9XYB0_9EUKA|nr:hypothetical protein BLNAU_8522 [Blattamonas nauphoetae]
MLSSLSQLLRNPSSSKISCSRSVEFSPPHPPFSDPPSLSPSLPPLPNQPSPSRRVSSSTISRPHLPHPPSFFSPKQPNRPSFSPTAGSRTPPRLVCGRLVLTALLNSIGIDSHNLLLRQPQARSSSSAPASQLSSEDNVSSRRVP